MGTDANGHSVVSNPYKGLEPLGDGDMLSGRTEDQQRLIYSLQSSRLTILYGEKQVGKTSLLRAGVGKELRHISAKQREAKQQERGPSRRVIPESAVIVFDDWSHSDIMRRLSSMVDEELARIGVTPPSDIKNLSFLERCRCWTQCLGDEGGELFLLFDQFDNYLMSHSRLSGTSGTFDFDFPSMVSTRGLAVNCLIAIREEFLASLDRYRRTIPNLYSSLVRLEPLNSKQAKEAIQNPVYEKFNSTHQDSKIGIEAQLVGAVLNSIQFSTTVQRPDEAAPQPSEQQFDAGALQLVMKAIWDEESRQGSQTLRHATFEGMGGTAGIALSYVDERFKTLTPSERHLAAKLCHHIVTSTGIGETHQLSELARQLSAAESEIESLTRKLDQGRLIAVAHRRHPGSLGYEIVHPILMPAVLDRVRGYFDESGREEARLGAGVENALRRFYGKSQLDGLSEAIKAGDDYRSAEKNGLLSSSELKGELQMALQGMLDKLEQRAQWGGYKGAVSSISFGPDGNVLVTGAEDGSVAIWNARSPGQRPVFHDGKHRTWIWALRITGDGRWLASGSDDGTVGLWALTDETLEYKRAVGDDDAPSMVRGLSFSPTEPLLAIATADGRVRLWHLNEEKFHVAFVANKVGVRCVEFSPDGQCLAAGGDDGVIGLWALDGSPLGRGWEGPSIRHEHAVWGIRFHPDGKRLASCSEDYSIKLWNLETGREERTLSGHTCWVLNIAYNSSGSLLASASEDGTARLWDDKGTQVAKFTHGAPVNGVCFSPDDSTLATAAADCRVRLWNVGPRRDSRRPKRFRHPGKAILLDVGVSCDGRYLATGATDREVQIWDEQGNITRRLKGHTHWIMSLTFHPARSATLATGSADGTARVWNLIDDTSTEFDPRDGPVWSVAFGPDGDSVATGSNGGRICRWDLRSPNAPPVAFPSNRGAVWSVRFSPDGKTIAAGCQDGGIQLRSLLSDEVVELTAVHAGQVLSLSFSPDSRLLASSSSEGRICIWDLARNDKPRWCHDVGTPVWAIAFDPGGEIVASGSVDRSVRLWDLNGKEVGGYSADGPIRGLSFRRPDGKWLACACSDGTVRSWPIHGEDFESLLERAKVELEKSASLMPL